MPIWAKNEPDPERRRITLLVYEDDGVTPAPMDTDFSSGNMFRTSGGAYAPANGAMLNVGVDGEWEYTATQLETNVDATEGVIMIPAQTIDGVDYAVSRAIVKLGSATMAPNEPNPFKRMTTVFIFEDDGVTPAPADTDFSTGNLLRASGEAYVAALGTMLNVGVDSEWEYGLTQAETNQDATELVVMVPAQTIGMTSFGSSRSIVSLLIPSSPMPPSPPSPIPSPIPTSSPDYIDHIEAAIDRLPLQFRRP